MVVSVVAGSMSQGSAGELLRDARRAERKLP